MTPVEAQEPTILPVAFGLEFGELSRRNGDAFYDIDHRLLARALTQAGHTEESMRQHPIIIENQSLFCQVDGEQVPRDAEDVFYQDGYLKLYTRGGYGPINAVVAVHEGKHMYEEIVDDEAFLTRRERFARKSAAVFGGIAVGAATYLITRLGLNTPESIVGGVAAFDITLCQLLTIEYATRPEEQRAFDAEYRAECGDILLINMVMSVKNGLPGEFTEKCVRAVNAFRNFFIPNFSA